MRARDALNDLVDKHRQVMLDPTRVIREMFYVQKEATVEALRKLAES